MNDKLITVFTPTYNRKHTLNRLYLSLAKQDTKVFEWLIVDDGSTDGTGDYIHKLMETSDVDIKYFWQKNGGKHRAHNKAVDLAKGKYFVIVDSDDELVPGAIGILKKIWTEIEDEKNYLIGAVNANCLDENGCVHGSKFPKQFLDGYHFDLAFSNILIGEKLPSFKLDVLKKYRFKEYPNDNELVPEDTVWHEISKKFKTRCVNESLRIYHHDTNDQSALSRVYGKKITPGMIEVNIVILNFLPKYFFKHFKVFIFSGIKLLIYSFNGYCNLFGTYLKLNYWAKILILLLFPISIPIFLFKIYKLPKSDCSKSV